jgi:hypothetical protein
MGLVPVKMKMPQVLKAECISRIVARYSGEEKEEVKRGEQSMTGTWFILLAVGNISIAKNHLIQYCMRMELKYTKAHERREIAKRVERGRNQMTPLCMHAQ